MSLGINALYGKCTFGETALCEICRPTIWTNMHYCDMNAQDKALW